MSSEGIVVLVLIVIAVVFVVWVRMHSQASDEAGEVAGFGEEGEKARNRE